MTDRRLIGSVANFGCWYLPVRIGSIRYKEDDNFN